MNWDTAPQELESLRAQVEQLKQHKKSALLNYIDADEQLAMMTEERDKVIAELAAVQSRLDGYSWEAENTALREQLAAMTKESDDTLDKWKTTLDQLAAAQLQVEQLKTALQEIIDCPTWAVGSLDMQRYRELMK
jgi:chromosome segregation ATPase